MTPQVVCFISLEHSYIKPILPIYVLRSLQGHLSAVLNFIFSLNISNEFALLIWLGINSHILGAIEDMLSVPKCTVRILRLCSSGSFLKLYGFCIKWKVSFIILGPNSFLSYRSLSQGFVDSFGECSLICLFLISHQKREMFHFCRQALKLFHEFC